MNQSVIYVSCGEGREIDVFRLDGVSGNLGLCQRLNTSGMPVPMRLSPDKRRLYVGFRAENALQAFAINTDTGELNCLGGISSPGAPVYIVSDARRQVVFVASYGDNNLSVFPLDSEGVPQAASQIESDLPRAHAARLDATERWLLVPMLGADAIRIYRLEEDLRLVPNDPPVILLRAGSGPRHPVFSPDNRFVYCLNELDGCIDVFAFDAQWGTLVLRQTVNMTPPGFDGAPWTAELRITPDGAFLYATDRRSSTIAALAVDRVSGNLSLIDHYVTECQPRGMDIDPGGAWLAVSGQQSSQLAVYAIDPKSGRLNLHQRHETGKDPICVEITVCQA